MFNGILPKETKFFDYFEEHAAGCVEILNLFKTLQSNPNVLGKTSTSIKEIENRLDSITQQCIEKTYDTFITPIERVDILKLINRLDDVADGITGAVSRMQLYEISSIRSDMNQYSDLLGKMLYEISAAVSGLRNTKFFHEVKDNCATIANLSKISEELVHKSMTGLFAEQDVLIIIKWKDVYAKLEKTLERCKEIAEIIEEIIIQAA